MCTTCGCGTDQVLIRGKTARHPNKPNEPLHFRAHERVVQTEVQVRPPLPNPLPHAGEGANESLREINFDRSEAKRIVKLEQDILAKNNSLAHSNRKRFAESAILALNLVSSPGSGKTTLLVHTLQALKGKLPLAVIEGDQQTDFDAERIRATGVEAIQINTGKGCHLDALMVEHALQQLPLPQDGVLFIENVGNLVCPAAFDLGEAAKVVVFSVTEGEDKPLKYPDMFRAARLMLLSKCDLLPHLDFDADLAIAYARRVNPQLQVIRLSATSGTGMAEWLEWITTACRAERVAAAQTA